MIRLLALLLLASPAMADPIEGVWQTQPDRNGVTGQVRIAACGAGFCGTAVQGPHSGTQVFRDVVPEGARYSKGRIVNPETGDSYAARLILDGDRLDVGGCILAICRSAGTWLRLD
ncbi:DUF2147 domain-containing protein [Falsirhodobacter halotolerans]|uniref:DUF2147 domain-containing protein n=1 Tax=Falsirhodobacter halotolerans TaxID=1146892 RepID=UPI001FCFCD96|nr:DUF2147 domain-containing protein [Falsirhodobacter halotolerans]MCJ8140321.1 DUF2147 domain-containing protein [Falsirhodobacter halotolerans]